MIEKTIEKLQTHNRLKDANKWQWLEQLLERLQKRFVQQVQEGDRAALEGFVVRNCDS